MYPVLLTTLTIAVVGVMLFSHYYLSKGRLEVVYPLNIVGFSLYLIIETMIAFHTPAQLSILLFNIVNFMGLYSAVRGYKRLKNKNT